MPRNALLQPCKYIKHLWTVRASTCGETSGHQTGEKNHPFTGLLNFRATDARLMTANQGRCVGCMRHSRCYKSLRLEKEDFYNETTTEHPHRTSWLSLFITIVTYEKLPDNLRISLRNLFYTTPSTIFINPPQQKV